LNTTGQPGGQRRRGVAAGRGKCQWKVAGAEHRHRAKADAVLAQIRTWQRLTIRQRLIDARAVKITATQHFGEQTHLAAGSSALALNASGRQRGFAADHGDEIIAERIQFIGDRVEKLRAFFGAEAAISRIRGSGGFSGGVDFFSRGLDEIVRQLFAGRGVDRLQFARCQRRCADRRCSCDREAWSLGIFVSNLSHGIWQASSYRFVDVPDPLVLEVPMLSGAKAAGTRNDAIDQRRAELGLADFEDVARLRRMPSANDRVAVPKNDMYVARTQELAVFEVVVFEVGQAVAHVRLAAEKLLLPKHFALRRMRLVPARC
jgi:hypothetical protein